MADSSQRGRRNRQRGREGEVEVVRILTGAGIDAVRKAPPGDDVRVNGRRAEVKRRKDGFRELYQWLEKDNSTYLFIRADRKCWLVVQRIEDFMEGIKRE